MKRAISRSYAQAVEKGQIERDPAQAALVARLEALAIELGDRQLANKGSALGWLFSRNKPAAPVRGLYIWGGVGRGKTMLMDLFFDNLQVRSKRRAHFHAFMADVHERIHQFRQRTLAGEAKGSDPVVPVAKGIARDASVLCFDELAVTDIADAMLLGRLFEALFAEGVTVVATSNREPNDLYKDGLNRSLFVPFIRKLEERLEVIKLEARTDYRLEKLGGAEVYLTPLGADTRTAFDAIFRRLIGAAPVVPATLEVKGRQLTLDETALRVARADFAELCDRPLGAGDYQAIAREFHTVMLWGVPVMDQSMRNAAKRFITLVDVFYDTNVKLVVAAEAPAHQLYKGETGAEVFEFERTVSRLIDMRSEEYLARGHGHSGVISLGSRPGIVET